MQCLQIFKDLSKFHKKAKNEKSANKYFAHLMKLRHKYPLVKYQGDINSPLLVLSKKHHFSVEVNNFPYTIKRSLFFTKEHDDYTKLSVYVSYFGVSSRAKITIMDDGKIENTYKHKYDLFVQMCPPCPEIMPFGVQGTSLAKEFNSVLLKLSKLLRYDCIECTKAFMDSQKAYKAQGLINSTQYSKYFNKYKNILSEVKTIK